MYRERRKLSVARVTDEISSLSGRDFKEVLESANEQLLCTVCDVRFEASEDYYTLDVMSTVGEVRLHT